MAGSRVRRLQFSLTLAASLQAAIRRLGKTRPLMRISLQIKARSVCKRDRFVLLDSALRGFETMTI
jgi:hypothetical protein